MRLGAQAAVAVGPFGEGAETGYPVVNHHESQWHLSKGRSVDCSRCGQGYESWKLVRLQCRVAIRVCLPEKVHTRCQGITISDISQLQGTNAAYNCAKDHKEETEVGLQGDLRPLSCANRRRCRRRGEMRTETVLSSSSLLRLLLVACRLLINLRYKTFFCGIALFSKPNDWRGTGCGCTHHFLSFCDD